MKKRPDLKRLPLTIVLLLTFLGAEPALCNFDELSWSRYRQVLANHDITDGYAAVTVDSELMEKSRPELSDLRLVTDKGATVPFSIVYEEDNATAEPFSVKVYRITRIPGKWTDIWIDKGAKVLTNELVIQTPSKDFVRRIEIRGSDNTKDYYIVSMDGLIVDAKSPQAFSSLSVKHPKNNFQYLHIRIIDGDSAPLKIDGVSCYPPYDRHAFLKPQDVRTLEKRTDPTNGATVLVADLGEKRLPLARLHFSTKREEFAKRVRILSSGTLGEGAWTVLYDGPAYRVRNEEALVEKVTFDLKPQPSRYVKVEITGGSKEPTPVDRLEAWGTTPMLVFDYKKGQNYRLFYGNPKAAAPSAGPRLQNVGKLLSSCPVLSLGEEFKPVAGKTPATQAPPQQTGVGKVGKAAGVGMLLVGLILLFSFMLRARSLRRERRGTHLRMLDPRSKGY